MLRTLDCLDDRAAYGLAMGTLEPALSAAAREHIDTCDSCRDLVAAVAVSADAPPPETIGRYQIEKVLGSGAMGIVYAATDPQLERKVAIKVLRGDAHRDRLLREAKAAAQISHPNVIAVFDAGVADGEVFMAMELVKGRTLREWLATKPSLDATIDALIAAGRGVAAIHAAGLVHRDIKPDNVLVADDGRIVVTDLGLVRLDAGPRDVAKAGPIELTQTGAMIGTPAYAAPEQLDGAETDARSDQFSLGVTIFEAVIGRRPFDGKNVGELRAAIGRGGLMTGTGVTGNVIGAAVRALRAKPEDRWPSVDALVGELVAARKPPAKRTLIAGALFGVAVLGGAAAFVMTRGTDGASCNTGKSEIAATWNPQRKAQIGVAFEATKVKYAPSTWTTAAAAIDDYTTKFAAAVDEACAATHVRKKQSAAVLDLRMQCLDRRRTELGALLDLFKAADAQQVDAAGSAIASLVPPSACADAELLQATEPMPDDPTKRTAVTDARAQLAKVDALSSSGKYKEALELVRQVSSTVSTIGYAPLVAEVDKERGRIAIDLQEWDEAKQALDRALLAAERGRHHHVRGDVQLALVYLAMQKDEPGKALDELARADALVAGLGGNDANRARVEDYRATALAKLGKLDEARVAAEKAVSLYESAEGTDSISLANPLTQLAYVNYQRNDLPAAIGFLERALAIQLKAFGPDHPRIGHAHTNLAFNLSAAGKLDEAEKHAQQAREVYAKSIGEASIPYRQATRALLGIQHRRGNFFEAEKLARGVVDALKPRKDTDATDYASSLEDLAAAIVAQQRHADALPLHQEVLAVREKVYPKGHLNIVSSLINIGDVLADLNRCKEALALYERAQQSADGPDVPPYLGISARLGRGRCAVEEKQYATALPPLRDALARNANPQDPDDIRLRAQTRFLLAQALAGTKKLPEAREQADLAIKEATDVGVTALADGVKAWADKTLR